MTLTDESKLFGSLWVFTLSEEASQALFEHRDDAEEPFAEGYSASELEAMREHALWLFRSRTGKPSYWYLRYSEDNHTTWWTFVRGPFRLRAGALELGVTARYRWQQGGGMGYDVSGFARDRESPEVRGRHRLLGAEASLSFRCAAGLFTREPPEKCTLFSSGETVQRLREFRARVRSWSEELEALRARYDARGLPLPALP